MNATHRPGVEIKWIRGIVVPVAWKDDAVVGLAISTADEIDYLVDMNTEGKELISMVGTEIEAKGRVRHECGRRMVTVDQCKLSRPSRRLRLGAAAAALILGGLLALGPAVEADAAVKKNRGGQASVKKAKAQKPKAAKVRQAKPRRASQATAQKAQGRKVQMALNDRGYNLQEDGRMGKKSQAALRSFQKKQGLKPTGQADPATLKALGLR